MQDASTKYGGVWQSEMCCFDFFIWLNVVKTHLTLLWGEATLTFDQMHHSVRHALTPNAIQTGLSFSKLIVASCYVFLNHNFAMANIYVSTKFDARQCMQIWDHGCRINTNAFSYWGRPSEN